MGPLSLWILTIGVIVAAVFTIGKLILDAAGLKFRGSKARSTFLAFVAIDRGERREQRPD